MLEIKDLSVRYTTDGVIAHAVNHVNLELDKGEILGIVGETGAGKTTTALGILNLLPRYTAQTDGEILFNGVNVLRASEKEMQKIRGEHISMIFQDPMTSLNPVYTVGDQIGRVVKIHNKEKGKEFVEQRVDEILNLVGIPAERKVEYPFNFSGGMKQRIMIAIALACNPELLIADEPTTALDVTIQAQVISMMRSLQRELGTAVILITHDLGLVANFCDKVAVMYSGEIIESGAIEQIFDSTNPHHPYVVGLFGSIPKITRKTKRLTPIEGLMPNPASLPEGCKFHPRCPYCMDICKTEEPEAVIVNDHLIKCHRCVRKEEA